MFFQKFAIVFLLILCILPIYISANDLKCLDVRNSKVKPILSGNKDTSRCVMVITIAAECKEFMLLYLPLDKKGIKEVSNCKQPEGAFNKAVKATNAIDVYKCFDNKARLKCVFSSNSTMNGSFDEFKNLAPHCSEACSDVIIDSAEFKVFGYNATMDPSVVALVHSSSQFHGNLFIFVYSLVPLYVALQ